MIIDVATTSPRAYRRLLLALAVSLTVVSSACGVEGSQESSATADSGSSAHESHHDPATKSVPTARAKAAGEAKHRDKHAASGKKSAADRSVAAKTKSSKAQRHDALTSGTAVKLLSTLRVKGRAPKTGYDRSEFGPAWSDTDHNGCDTRNDILRRDLTHKIYRAGTGGCMVLSGTLHEPYTGKTIDFVRGIGTSNAVQIDHVVALMDAWQKGAQNLSSTQRLALANDPLNLLAADGPSNARKQASDAATWLPPRKPFRCRYVARQVSVKAKYRLWVTQAEHDAIARILSSCPGQSAAAVTPIPPMHSSGESSASHSRSSHTAAPRSTRPHSTAPRPKATRRPAPKSHPAPKKPSAAYYKNCDAVRAAGAAPIHRGQPGYAAHLDRDGDGVGCE